MTTTQILPERNCLTCGKILYKHKNERQRDWIKRKYCSTRCSNRRFHVSGKAHASWKHGHRSGPNGLKKTPELNSHAAMMTRCYNPNVEQFKDYGGRGILVAPEWHDSVTFLADMGPKPDRSYSLGRLDNNAGYSKANCQWQSRFKQAQNTRASTLTMAKAREIRILRAARGYKLRELAKEFGVALTTVSRVVHNKHYREQFC